MRLPGKIALAAALAVLVAAASSRAEGRDFADAVDLSIFRALPVQDGGRIKPVDTFARELLAFVGGEETFEGRDPVYTLLVLLSDADKRQGLRIITVGYKPLQERLLGKHLVSGKHPGRFSAGDFTAGTRVRKNLNALLAGDGAGGLKMLRAARRLEKQYMAVRNVKLALRIIPPPPMPDVMRRRGAAAGFFAVWKSPAEELRVLETSPAELASYKRRMDEARVLFARVLDAFRARDAVRFKAAAADFRTMLENDVNPAVVAAVENLALECTYNRVKPFRYAYLLYLFVFLVFLAGAVTKNRAAEKLAYYLLIAGFFLHTGAIAMRTLVAGRIPLSNTYEYLISFVWAAVLLCIVLQKFFELSAMVGVVSFSAFTGLVLAQHAPIARRIAPLQPILNTSWLQYHVITVIFAYGAMMIAAGLAVYYLAAGLGGKKSAAAAGVPDRLAKLDGYIYKVIQIGFLFLTLGIITGSIWASVSWGRYWGWDPKETWAAITWAIYGMYLHMRLTGKWRGRTCAIMAVVGFLAVIFTFFGVNYLLRGLHSYA